MLKRLNKRRERAAVGVPHDGVGSRDRLVERADRIVCPRQAELAADFLTSLVDVVLVVEPRLQRIRRAPHLLKVAAGGEFEMSSQ